MRMEIKTTNTRLNDKADGKLLCLWPTPATDFMREENFKTRFWSWSLGGTSVITLLIADQCIRYYGQICLHKWLTAFIPSNRFPYSNNMLISASDLASCEFIMSQNQESEVIFLDLDQLTLHACKCRFSYLPHAL